MESEDRYTWVWMLLAGILCIGMTAATVWLTADQVMRERQMQADILWITQTDTVRITDVTPVESIVVRYVTKRVPVSETPNESDTDTFATDISVASKSEDSVDVVLPIAQKVYKDSSYTAWVSGYMPQLDSIHVYRRKEIVRIKEREPPNRWHIGPTAGVCFTPSGVQPYVGVGVTYSLLGF